MERDKGLWRLELKVRKPVAMLEEGYRAQDKQLMIGGLGLAALSVCEVCRSCSEICVGFR